MSEELSFTRMLGSLTGLDLKAIYEGYKEQIRAVLDHPGTINIAGHPGTGKTHVAYDLARELGLRSYELLWSSGYYPPPVYSIKDMMAGRVRFPERISEGWALHIQDYARNNAGPGWIILDMGSAVKPVNPRSGLPYELVDLILNIHPWTIPTGWRLILTSTVPLGPEFHIPTIHFNHVQ